MDKNKKNSLTRQVSSNSFQKRKTIMSKSNIKEKHMTVFDTNTINSMNGVEYKFMDFQNRLNELQSLKTNKKNLQSILLYSEELVQNLDSMKKSIDLLTNCVHNYPAQFFKGFPKESECFSNQMNFFSILSTLMGKIYDVITESLNKDFIELETQSAAQADESLQRCSNSIANSNKQYIQRLKSATKNKKKDNVINDENQRYIKEAADFLETEIDNSNNIFTKMIESQHRLWYEKIRTMQNGLSSALKIAYNDSKKIQSNTKTLKLENLPNSNESDKTNESLMKTKSTPNELDALRNSPQAEPKKPEISGFKTIKMKKSQKKDSKRASIMFTRTGFTQNKIDADDSETKKNCDNVNDASKSSENIICHDSISNQNIQATDNKISQLLVGHNRSSSKSSKKDVKSSPAPERESSTFHEKENLAKAISSFVRDEILQEMDSSDGVFLFFEANAMLKIDIDSEENGWIFGVLISDKSKEGWFPKNRVELLK